MLTFCCMHQLPCIASYRKLSPPKLASGLNINTDAVSRTADLSRTCVLAVSVLETLVAPMCSFEGPTAVDSLLIGLFVSQRAMIHQLRKANYPAGQLPTDICVPAPNVYPPFPGTISSDYLNYCFIGRYSTSVLAL
jgi:hypothetical protein